MKVYPRIGEPKIQKHYISHDINQKKKSWNNGKGFWEKSRLIFLLENGDDTGYVHTYMIKNKIHWKIINLIGYSFPHKMQDDIWYFFKVLVFEHLTMCQML